MTISDLDLAVMRSASPATSTAKLIGLCRDAAAEIEYMRAEREAMQEMFPARPGVLREAMERKRQSKERD